LWQRTTTGSKTARRAENPSNARHPLLASMARDATELQLRLTRLAIDTTDVHHPGERPPSTLLGALQAQLRDDEPPQQPATLDERDRSVQVHACHGRARQVEVLREVLVGLFADDQSLEPRDVLVMCPDVEVFAPLISATFGLAPDDEEATHDVHPGHRLRVRLADRSLRQTNPVLSLLAQLLSLADSRVTASEVLDLAASEPVRRRFSCDDDDLDRLRDWAVTAGARWGEDRDRRARFGLGAVGQNTWDAALDRILLGVAMEEEDQRWIGSALPLDDVGSTDVDLAGRLAELLARLTDVLQSLDGTAPIDTWVDALDRALDLLADVRPSDGWQLVQARRVLGDVRTTGEGHDRSDLRLPDVRALLAGRLEGRPTRANFRTGHLTLCSLVPMRSVPHRVVCLLGMDDGVFPRGASTDGDDVLLRDPLVGERDRRSEDRQLFLDAVLAARDHLVVLHTGADERTGAVRPPAVPVGELLDALDRTAHTADGRPARAQVVVRHPLQPFDERNFTLPEPFSFDSTALAGALAARGEREGDAPFLPGPLPAEPPAEVVALDDLVRFLEHPVKEFLRRRLGVVLSSEDDDVSDRLPLQLDALEGWAVGERLLTARLAGADAGASVDEERRRGLVPPKGLGGVVVAEAAERVEQLMTAVVPLRGGQAQAVDVVVGLSGGRGLAGTVTGVHGHRVVRATYSRLGPKHRLRAWVQLLALGATEPGTSWEAVTIGRGPGRRPTARLSVLTCPDAGTGRDLLAQLVDLRDRGMCEPLPMAVGASCAYAASCVAGDAAAQALDAAAKAWSPFEAADEHHTAVWGEGAALNQLLADAPHGDEGPWFPDEATRFGALARRVWEPLLAHEQTETP
ncbi:MAG TPA: exodeoxyribonuclease V subunit gamma, partial [Actinomycetales bacterium]|nr:exodeoxyribonuclease V subunit gamma [Actinomycetales bacterium]